MHVTWWMPSSCMSSLSAIVECSKNSAGRAPANALRDRGEQEHPRFLHHLARDHEPLDLLRALVDLGDLRIAHEALGGVLLDVAVAAEDLDGLGRDRHGDV